MKEKIKKYILVYKISFSTKQGTFFEFNEIVVVWEVDRW